MLSNKKNRWFVLVTLLLIALVLAACGVQPAATPAEEVEEAAAPAEEMEEAEAPAEEMEEAEAPAEEVEEAEEEEAAAEVVVSDRCGDPEQLSDTLNFYNWADYIDEGILTMFEEECGVKVVMDLYTSNEEAVAKITAGNSGYDLSIPTDYAVKIMSDAGALQPLDYDLIPNSAKIDPEAMGMYYDPDNTYSLPYQWSTTGIAYNVNYFPEPPTSYDVLFDMDILCENKGFVSMLDDPRETPSMALQYLGYSVNETDPAVHEEVLALLREQKECIAGYNSENFIQTLAAEEVVMAGSWGFAAALAYFENENIRYFIPEEGGIIWQDNMVVPVDAPHPYTAHVFINYLLEPDIGALLTEWTLGVTPNLEVVPLLSDDYYDTFETVGLIVDDATRERLEWQERGEGAEIFADTWTSVKAE
jgi:spermidine/putrescine transport system substrate-binding protein